MYFTSIKEVRSGMPALVIKQLPEDIHERLKESATLHRRSMTQEAVEILDRALRGVNPVPERRAYRGTFSLTDKLMNQAKREGRA